MPIDPYAALNAMLRAEAARFSPPARKEGQDRPRADRALADRTVPQPATAEAESGSGTVSGSVSGSSSGAVSGSASEHPQRDRPAGSAA